MMVLALVQWAVTLIDIALTVVIVTGMMCVGFWISEWLHPIMEEQKRHEREHLRYRRERQARRTARAIRRMTEIRYQTMRRMDEAEMGLRDE